MLRTTLLAAALFFSPAALACGGADCGGNCPMKGAHAEAPADTVDQAEGTKLVLNVEGMSCGSCAQKITAALTALDGVNAAFVDSSAGTAKIAFDAAKIDEAKLIATVAAAGPYTASKPAEG